MLKGRLDQIKLKNFKSFKTAKIPLAQGCTTIVGPNGSGKSNLVDALCFVVGATSMKNLRADRLTDLVNHTSKDGTAEVELGIVDNGGETHTLSRTIDKKGTSVFRLNSRRTTKFHIDELLSTMNIKSGGHNIIMQGDVTRFIKMTPQQRREIIDNICGIADYETKKQESLKELDKVQEKIKEATIVLSEKKGYLHILEKEKIEAEVYMDLRKDYKDHQGTLIKKELDSVEKVFTKALNFLATAKDRLERLETEKDRTISKLRQTEKDADGLSRKIFEESDKKQTSIRLEIEEVKTNIATLEEKINGFRNLIEKNREKKEILTKRISSVSLEVKKKQEELEDLELEEQKLKKDIKRRESELGKVGQVGKLYRNLDELNEKIEEKREKLYDLYGDVKSLTEGMNLKRGLIEQTNVEIRRIKEKNKEFDKKLAILNSVIDILENIEKNLERLNAFKGEGAEVRKDLNRIKAMLLDFKKESFDYGLTPKEGESEKIQKELSSIEMTLLEKKQKTNALQKDISRVMEERLKIKQGFEDLGIEEEGGRKTESMYQKLRDRLNDVKVQRKTLESEIEKVLTKRKQEAEEEIRIIDTEVENLEKERDKVDEQRNSFLRVLRQKEAKAREISTSMTDMYEKKNQLEKMKDELAKELSDKDTEIENLKSEMNESELNKARHETRYEDLKREFEKYQDAEILDLTKIALREKIAEVEKQLEVIGKVNMKAIGMFEQYSKEVKDITERREKLEEERESIMNMMSEIEKKKMKAFTETFEALNNNFGKYFKEFYPEEGAKAALKLEKPDVPLDSGLKIEAKPAGKELRLIDSMSGGEKTLTALAFLFAIQAYSPSPFYILDEVDAALDKENSERLAKMLRKATKELQFILITHNPSVIRVSDQIIGVHMGKDGSSFVEVDLKSYQPELKAAV